MTTATPRQQLADFMAASRTQYGQQQDAWPREIRERAQELTAALWVWIDQTRAAAK